MRNEDVLCGVRAASPLVTYARCCCLLVQFYSSTVLHTANMHCSFGQ
jgi:hypothetical protein